MSRFTLAVPLGLALTLILGCSGGSGPTAPASDESPVKNTASSAMNHYLLGYYLITAQDKGLGLQATPVRDIEFHWNVIRFLEQTLCSNCVMIVNESPGPGGADNISVEIRHPLPKSALNQTRFDGRGIVMFQGSHKFPASNLTMSDKDLGEGELLNADGYTSLYNPSTSAHAPLQGYLTGKLSIGTPTATLNGFKRYPANDPGNKRNAFYSGYSGIATFSIRLPNPVVFGYAVDACWAPPTKKPVTNPMTDFPITANCAEPWKIDASVVSSDLTNNGGSATIGMNVYDWQGKDSHKAPKVECPELFDGEVAATWTFDGAGFSTYTATVQNSKLAAIGHYRCLISVTDNDQEPVGDLLTDLTAYQVMTAGVAPSLSLAQEVTPPWLNGCPCDMAVQGNYAYTVAGDYGFHVYDISDPTNIKWLARLTFPGIVDKIKVSGHYAYIGTNYYYDHALDFYIVDVSNPAAPILANTVELPDSPAAGFCISDGYAYILSYSEPQNLLVMSIDDPENASIVNTFAINPTSWGTLIYVSNGYAYYCHGRILEIYGNAPASPTLINSVTLSHKAEELTVCAGYAYIVTDSATFEIVKVDPPEAAFIVNTLSLGSDTDDVEVSNGYAYVAGGVSSGYGVTVIHVDPPEGAGVVASLRVDPFGGIQAFGIGLSGDDAILESGTGLRSVDISDPLNPALEGRYWTPAGNISLAVSNGYEYLVGEQRYLQIVKVDPPEEARCVNMIEVGMAWAAKAIGDYVYVASEEEGLVIVDVSDPESAYIVNSVSCDYDALVLDVVGDYAYVTGWWRLYIVSINPVESAHVVGQVYLGDIGRDIIVRDGYAVIAVNAGGFNDYYIVDVDPIGSAHVVRSLYEGFDDVDIDGMDGYCYGVGNGDYVNVWRYAPASDAGLVESLTCYSFCTGIKEIPAGFAFVPCENGIAVLDTGDPENTTVVGCMPLGLVQGSIDISGDYGYTTSLTHTRIFKLW